jgi:hypothetical protein
MTKQHTLLAGIAALALFAASGIASAQQTQQDQKGAGSAAQSSSAQSERSQQGATTRGRSQSANQGMRNPSAQQDRNQNAMSRQSSGQNAQNQSGMQSREGNARNRSAQQQSRNRGTNATNQTAQSQQNQRNAQSRTNQTQRNAQSTRTNQSRNGQFANEQRNRGQRGTSTAQRNEQMRGLQGSTRAPMQGANEQGGGANVSLNDQQRTQIRDTVINSRNAPRISNPRFSVNVGTVVPRGQIRLVRVPQPLIRIHPGWRRFVYFVYNDQIVIVDPRTMRIVDVVSV